MFLRRCSALVRGLRAYSTEAPLEGSESLASKASEQLKSSSENKPKRQFKRRSDQNSRRADFQRNSRGPPKAGGARFNNQQKPRFNRGDASTRKPRRFQQPEESIESLVSSNNADMKPFVDRALKMFAEVPDKVFAAQGLTKHVEKLNQLTEKLEQAAEQRDKFRECELPRAKLDLIKSLGLIESSIDGTEIKETWNTLDTLRELSQVYKEFNYFASEDALQYKLTEPDAAELEINKSKMGYSVKSRLLRALSTLSEQSGLSLDSANLGQSKLHGMSKLYPFANPNVPKFGYSEVADLNSLSSTTDANVKKIIDSTVKGIRPELKFYKSNEFKTEQARVNAEVVSHGLNSNAQLQVDDMHVQLGNVFVGKGKLADIPKPLPASK
ncbi:hypothetical protein OGAPHI_004292 [Ogataea philodendri]|uniref:Uncharacterized protein n=1 Tax=Ogataea philodendri TaxID=1378263 RepID=A0A9P8P5X6_9ASCO|nr:uncharacterized protein OGAPHI_004292 [Ogataea philodendri]KAH3666103.1 hypothetical protein OGAPHI_004292 [Ogataea philodendri]